jgi:metal-responsive CopG/Arc/MetJ family transcriptional regulator
LQKALEEEHELIGGTRSSIIRTALQEYLNEQKIKRYKQMIAYEKLKKKAEDANV